MRGDNLPAFRARQLEFAAYIRDPLVQPSPADVDARRMQVYVELFYRNIEGLLAGAFPVAKRVLGDAAWRELVRQFIARHPSASPYFLEISQEFIEFINGLEDYSLPEFMVELCHYEWVELGLGVADEPEPPEDIDANGDLLTGPVVRSPLAWPLSYAYPVHRIGPGYQPDAPDEQPTHLIVYRGRDDGIRFMEVNALTQRMLLLLDGMLTGRAVLAQLAAEAPGLAPGGIEEPGLEILERLRIAGIILGVRRPDAATGASARD